MEETEDRVIVISQNIGVVNVCGAPLEAEQYQVVQESESCITCRIVKGEEYSEADENLIRESLLTHIGEAEIAFEYVESIKPIDGRKHRFLVNQTSRGV